MKKLNLFALALLFVGAIACQNSGSTETEDAADDAVEEVSEDMEDAADDMDDAAEEMADDAEEMADSTMDGAEEAAGEMTEDMDGDHSEEGEHESM